MMDAAGGIVPAGRPIMLGNGDPETVLPLSQRITILPMGISAERYLAAMRRKPLARRWQRTFRRLGS